MVFDLLSPSQGHQFDPRVNFSVYSESYVIITNFKNSNIFFSNLGQLGTKIVKRLKNDKCNKHIPVLDIVKKEIGSYLWHCRNSTLKKVQCDLSFIRVMQCERCFEDSALHDPFSHVLLI